MGAVSSVQTKLISHADKARFTLIEMKKLDKPDPSQWAGVEKALECLTPEFCQRFFARMVSMVPVIIKNQRKLQVEFARRHSHRFGQQYGSLLAGYAALVVDCELSDAEVKALADQVSLDNEVSSSSEREHEGCLAHLLETHIDDPMSDKRKRTTMGKMLIHEDGTLYRDALFMFGVIIT